MRILITSGGTREYIDPVRFISNASSGRMGYALAGSALEAGHEVTVISAAERDKNPDGAEFVETRSSAQMFEAVRNHWQDFDCLIMAAAVCDFTPVERANKKIKKGQGEFVIRLKPTVDILEWAGGHKTARQVLVGFALDDTDLRQRAEEKMERKNLDIVVANSPAAIDAAQAEVQIKVSSEPWQQVEKSDKAEIARLILRQIGQVYAGKTGQNTGL